MRRKRFRPMRLIGLPENFSRNAASSRAARPASLGAARSSRAR
ncbi:hypothetical protein RB2654_15380 [Rhodobacterales bacterium HTCC2654]|uniref:Uncharacterized protein n=1 Tax=Maritimibacter alkaliphilus HTCC2654 TaxID=314271 RepID=A3VHC5_9RHOB|nr:hypothetical protein RB2654_15380 [Rhodobacterales bacterium HTCC2654] [Maritimibacter alkaliphilus HTCC2654]